MSFPVQDVSQRPSPRSSERPPRRSNSSWLSRLHRHDDCKPYQCDSGLERPLVADDGLVEKDEGFYDQQVLPSTGEDGLRRLLPAVNHHLEKAYSASRRLPVCNRKHILIVCLLALLSLLIPILLGFLLLYKEGKKQSACQSAACVHAASEILYNLDPNHGHLDACTQFDKFVCGGWEQRHDLRPDQGDMFTGTIMAENSKTILRHILEQSSPTTLSSTADQDIFKKLKDDYDSCMDEQELEKIGLKPLLAIIKQIQTSFPATVVFTEQNALTTLESGTQKGVAFDGTNQLTDTLLYLMKLDVRAFLEFDVQADDRDPDSQILMITPPRSIGLPSKEYYENKDLVDDYRNISAMVLREVYWKSTDDVKLATDWRGSIRLNKPVLPMGPQADIEDLAQGVVDLEVKLAAATPPTEDQEDVTKYYNPMTLTELDALLPQISFKYIVSQLAPKGYFPNKVIVGSPGYMTALARLLSTSRKETLQAFLVWKAVQQYEDKVQDRSVQPLRAFNNQLRGLDPSAKEERWRTCIDAVDQDLGWILSKFFVESAFSEASKTFGDQIVTNIKNSFTTTLDKTEWMSKDVRERAIQKVHAIDQKIGYPTSNPDVLDSIALKEYYSSVAISNSTFFENKVQVAQFSTRRAWNKLGKPTRRDEWGMTVPTVNAYYNPAGNEIVFPAGIMQAPVFYDASVPQYLTYGAFGAVSGHELSHAFDSTGSHYDETGNYTDWFDESTKSAFDSRTKCFEKQYSRFSVTGPEGETLHVNGKLTLGENIADAGGLHAAFDAWQKRREGAERWEEEALPGLQDFTPEQLFFISYGNWWCGKSTRAKAVERIYTDPHAPKWARILGTMDNSAEFKKAFNCKRLKPTCKLW